MNYKNITLRELIEFGNENPNYTVGDLLFSILQPVAVHNKKGSLQWLRDISDEQMFTFVDKARELEKEDEPVVSEIEIITILKL
jgi:hypothetical protein